MVTYEWIQRQIDETLKQPEGRQTVIDLAMLYIVRDHLLSSASTPEDKNRIRDEMTWAALMRGAER